MRQLQILCRIYVVADTSLMIITQSSFMKVGAVSTTELAKRRDSELL